MSPAGPSAEAPDARRARLLAGAFGARPLAGAFGALVAATFGLITLGALVRAHGAGLACPDWPLCFGALVPRMDVKVAFEWTHRLVAGGVGATFFVLAAAAWRFSATRRLLVAAALLLAVQVVLGALTVWHLLAAWTVTAHLVAANLFAVTLLLVCAQLAEQARPRPRRRAACGAVRVLLPGAAALLALQVVLGGLVSSSYAGLACPEWPACIDGEWLPAIGGNVRLHLLHRLNGYLLAAALAAAAWAARREPGLGGLAALALVLVLSQVAVGVANVLLGLPVEVTGLHTALAALLVATLALALRELWVRPGHVAAPRA